MDYLSSDSESVISSSTFDDEHSDNISFVFRQSNSYNYLDDVKNTIQNHDDITIENGLALNVKYRQLLIDLRTKFEQMYKAVKEKYAANEELLDQLRNHSAPKNVATRNASLYICGAPYFKEEDLTSGPNNKDYIYRKNVRKEFFPIDYLSLPKRFWTSKDKVDIVKGVKEQIINHLRAGNSSDISEIRNNSKSSRSTSKKITNMRELTSDLEKKPFAQLYKMIEHVNFSIDWNKISFKNLDSRHYPNECMAMWNHYLKPGLNHGLWSEEEDEKLQDAIIRHNYQDWNAIAEATHKRSPMQCFVHYRIALSESAQVKKNEKFTPFEDQQLLELVNKYSDGDVISWTKVCQQMPGRNRYQCYHRYQFTIKPGIKRGRFTTEEDCAILAYVHAHGQNFGKMPPNLFPGRTPVQIRNRYMNTLKAKDNKVWTLDEDQKLMDFVKENGTNKWSEFSRLLGTKTRFACRCRYSTITKFLERNPDLELKDVTRKEKKKLTTVNINNYLEEASKLKAIREGRPITIDPTENSSGIKQKFKGKVFEEQIEKIRKNVTGERQNKVGQQLCEIFKYSYNWRMIPNRIPRIFPTEASERTFTMLQLLDFQLDLDQFQANFTQLTPENQTNLTLSLNVEVSSQLKDDIRFVKTFGNRIPVNLNTVLAWRAMQMMVLNKPLVKVERPQVGPYAAKYNLFLRRFKKIFYLTALLSKIDLKHIKDRLTMLRESAEANHQMIQLEDVETESVYCDNDDGNQEDNEEDLYDVPMTIKEELGMESETDEENAVDFLLSHIKTKENLKKAKSSQEQVLDMPMDYFDYIDEESTETTVETSSNVEKRKNESPVTSNEFKKPKRIAAKSMPLT